jgi:Zn-dependent M28 family amino/carboxypeptidase
MKGRASGSPELEKAARYIADQFRADGLQTVGGSFMQPFDVTTSSKLGKGNHFEFVHAGKSVALQISKDFVPYNFSSSGKASGPVVFAGYGITAPEYNYDDYAGIDVQGKFVIVLAHEPQEFDEKSPFDGKVYTDHSQAYSKAANARKHGAKGVILVFDRVNHKDGKDELEAFGRADGPADAGIPFVQVTEASVDEWIKRSGKDLGDTEAGINADLKPRSFDMPGIEVTETVELERAVKTVHNVLGYLPGETSEYIIIGAHYDHLGLGEQFSMAPSMAGTVHPGADDNASGTAGVLELAQYFSAGPKPKRGILFMTYAGEELGLLGSGFYANHPILPLDHAIAMLNMDMIGRVREDKLYIGGAATGTTFRADLQQLVSGTNFHVDFSDSGYGSSDHTSFTAKQVPVLFFFSGLHGDYHKPSDTWDKIDAPAAIQVLKLVAGMATKLEDEKDRPVFVRVEEKSNPHAGSVSPSGSASGGGYGPNFGSVPDFSEPPTGVRFADVHPDSPAGLAGLKPGDILVKFGDAEIRNLYDFTYALRAHKAGDEVEVQVLRGTGKISVSVKLTERK